MQKTQVISHSKYVALIHRLQKEKQINLADISTQDNQSTQEIGDTLRLLAAQGAPFAVNGEILTLVKDKLGELLSAKDIYTALNIFAKDRHKIDLRLSVSCPSTNLHLKEFKNVPDHTCVVSITEAQTAGVGRMGRRWVSQFGTNIYFSMRKKTNIPAHRLSPFSLVVGLGVIDTLNRLGIEGLMLKWPNDIYFEGKKLAGVLIELVKQDKNSVDLVIGVGINVKMDPLFAKEIDQKWTDLHSINKHMAISRNLIIAELTNTLLQFITQYELDGFSQFKNKWEKVDYLFGKAVQVKGGSILHSGIANGISVNGELLVDSSGTLHKISSGEVSVRLS